MGDFNAVPSPNLIDSYRIIYPDSSSFTWKRDNSQEQSRIDIIWIPQQWGKKIIECFTEQLELVTKSDHKIIQLKIKKTWQIHLDREVQNNIGPKYNIKLMCDEKWMKFTTH
ncbi:3624_t:CDS:2, partial [Dentiscutata erythropus]